MKSFRYTLEPGSKKYVCPSCNRKKKYVRYIDTITKEYLPYEYGRCDRDKCSYHLNPYKTDYGLIKETNFVIENMPRHEIKKPLEPFKTDEFLKTLEHTRYEYNNFIQNIYNKYCVDFEELDKVISMYCLGTIVKGKYKGALTIPYIDRNENIRAVQVKTFDENNHTVLTTWLHSILNYHFKTKQLQPPEWLGKYNENEKLVTCLFGEHLLNKYPNNPIGLVEAPKTAIYGTLYYGLPKTKNDMLWLAVFNKQSYKLEKIKVLQGRKILVYPDLSHDGSTFKEWQLKSTQFEKMLNDTTFVMYDELEKIATPEQREKGYDLADFLVMQWNNKITTQ